ncbi:MAG: caspase family protein [Muribaculaceae bacterium]|nr:caspase family protein [Muribaculaceae bacterium]
MRLKGILVLILLGVVFFCNATNRALLVGIGRYDQMKTGWSRIHGDKDVELLEPLLKKQGFEDIRSIINSEATKEAIVRELKNLAERSKEGDKVYFHFSGHGQPVRDDNKDEEKAGKKYDESIIPFDACRDNLKMEGKYEGENHLIDDELAPLFDAIKKKIGRKGEFLIVIDACYSKGIQKDEVTEIDPDILRYARGTDQPFVPKPGSRYLANLPKPKDFSSGSEIIVITACGSDESNYEYKVNQNLRYGSLSYYISLLLKKDADFYRWKEMFIKCDYAKRNIFQSIQHPSIEIIP